MAVAERFIFNSDYPLDKIVWFKEGELTSKYGDWDITIPHDLKTTLYVKGVVTSNDWATTYPVGVSIVNGDITKMQSTARANDKNVVFNGFVDGSNVKIKYRLWAVMSEEETKGIDVLTTSDADRNILFFDSEYTYPKLIAEGYLNKGERFYHNLGYIPFCDIWAKVPGVSGNYWWQWNDDQFGTTYGYGNIVRNNTERIKLESIDGGPDKIYYRIYL